MSLESDIETLRRVELFAGFEDGQLRMLASGSERLELSTGDRVFDKDGLSNGGYVVVGGNIDLISGINRRIISSNRPGTLIGELGLIDPDMKVYGSAHTVSDRSKAKMTHDILSSIRNPNGSWVGEVMIAFPPIEST